MSAYDFVNKINRVRRKDGACIEIGTVSGINPLVVTIGNGVYNSTQWRFYEPVFDIEEGEMSEGLLEGTSVSCNVGYASGISYQKHKFKKCLARMRYEVGDLLAVMQLDGGRSFLIIAKIKAV